MCTPPSIRCARMRAARRSGREGSRTQARQQHAGLARHSGLRRLTELFDSVRAAASTNPRWPIFPNQAAEFRDEVALVALGGYGRGDVAPYSDVDLMILHSRAATQVSPLAKRLLHDLYDVGLELGHSVRTPQRRLPARRSKTRRSSPPLAEARFIVGSEPLYGKFNRNFPRVGQSPLAKHR